MRMIWCIDLEQHIEEAETYGDPDLTLQLGRLNERGCAIRKDMDKARYWYQKSADAGNGEALYRLSLMVREDKYNRHSEEQADKLLQKSLLTGYVHEEEPSYLVEAFITVVSLVIVAGFLWYVAPVLGSILSVVF
jgi:TPR repeat protein